MRILTAVRSLDPPGRFLIEKDPPGKNKGYVDAPTQRVIDKTLQALRERKWRARSTTAAGALGDEFCRKHKEIQLAEERAIKEEKKPAKKSSRVTKKMKLIVKRSIHYDIRNLK